MSFPIAFPSTSKPWVSVSISGNGAYYLVEFDAPPDNRLSKEFIQAYVDALDYVRVKGDPRVLVSTSKITKFFSNGLNYESAISTPGFFSNHLFKLLRTLLTFPWPTVALVNGHAFAAGFMIALCHDYRIMNPNRGFLCMNEMDFGALLSGPMMTMFSVKFGTKLTHRITLNAHRFSGKEAFEAGIVDGLGSIAEVEAFIKNPEITKGVKGPSYASNRIQLVKEILNGFETYEEDVVRDLQKAKAEAEYYKNRERELDAQVAKSRL